MIYKWQVDEFDFIQYIPQEKYEHASLILLVNVGSNNDGSRGGISHYLEHMLVAKLTNFFYDNNINFIATTYFDFTSYEILCKNNMDDILKYIYVLMDIYNGKYLTPNILENVRQDIILEFNQVTTSSQYKRVIELSKYDNSIGNMAIGTIDTIKSLNYSEIINFYKENYLDVTIGIVSELDIKTKLNVNKLEELSMEFLPKKYGKNPKGILFEQDSKYILYQKEAYFNSSYRIRFIEDLSTSIIETFFFDKYGIEISFYKAYYGKQNKYWILNINCDIKYFLKIIQKQKSRIGILPQEIKHYREEYIEKIRDIYLNIQSCTSELLWYLAYGIPVYEYSAYQKMNELVSDDEILKEVFDRLANYDINFIEEARAKDIKKMGT